MFALFLLLYRNKEQAVKYPGQVTPPAQKRKFHIKWELHFM